MDGQGHAGPVVGCSRRHEALHLLGPRAGVTTVTSVTNDKENFK
jgi:hypothetical protein